MFTEIAEYFLQDLIMVLRMGKRMEYPVGTQGRIASVKHGIQIPASFEQFVLPLFAHVFQHIERFQIDAVEKLTETVLKKSILRKILDAGRCKRCGVPQDKPSGFFGFLIGVGTADNDDVIDSGV